MENPELAELPELLLPWFRACGRALPWRRDRSPYHVWLSEIMLQQTRAETVRAYYLRFLDELPTIAALAACSEERLYKLWEGLGYYARARNLRKAARVIQEKYGGRFPETYDEIRALPGVGDYTAGAVCSICFGLPTPAVDGNVLRVLARLCACAEPVDRPAVRKEAAALLSALYPASDADGLTQSLMELGATVCVPNGPPKCGGCPVRRICKGLRLGVAETLPVRTRRPPRRAEEMTVIVAECGGALAVEKRAERGLLAGMWQFPNTAGRLSEAEALSLAAAWGLRSPRVLRRAEHTHIFTHVEWRMVCYYMSCAARPARFVWADAARFSDEIALPTAFRVFCGRAETERGGV